MIYFVSGWMRSGTSMAMQCLEAGGMEVAYSPERNKRMNKQWGSDDLPKPYYPNDNYYELDQADYRSPQFPHCYEGKLVKCLWGGIARLKNKLPGSEGYRVIFMRRPRQSIETSLIAAFGYSHPVVQDPGFDAHMDSIVDLLKDRKSFVSVDQVRYTDVVADPLNVFKDLAEKGWPIDPEKAATIPSKKKMRFVA